MADETGIPEAALFRADAGPDVNGKSFSTRSNSRCANSVCDAPVQMAERPEGVMKKPILRKMQILRRVHRG
jgi:hypothetical protein